MATKTKTMTYRVTGVGSFPMDMLRYDRVTPATESDSARIERTFSRYEVRAQFTVAVTGERCTASRWESFGWKVLDK